MDTVSSDTKHGVAAAPDPEAVLAALGVTDAGSLTPVEGGRDTAIWRVERPGGACALRVFRPEQHGSFERELAAMAAARAAGVPVPEVRAHGAWQGRPAMLLSWCAGRPLALALLDQPADAPYLGDAFGRMQAAIHAVPVPAALAGAPPRWLERVESEAPGLAARVRTAMAGARALLHLDYHPMNVLVDGRRITAVLDWTDAGVGDPRLDLARTSAVFRAAPLPPPFSSPAAVGALRAFQRAWRDGYRDAAGAASGRGAADAGRDQAMALFYAWAGAATAASAARRLAGPNDAEGRFILERVRRWTGRWLERAGGRGPEEPGLD